MTNCDSLRGMPVDQDAVLPPSAGRLSACGEQSCGHVCCDFSQGNYILLYPGEWEAARLQALATEHLSIRADGLGGHRAVCHARDRSTCDGGYKPLDCACYPLFPSLDDEGRLVVVDKGAKCPLRWHLLSRHRVWVAQQWNRLIRADGAISTWLRAARLVGYQKRDQRASLSPPGDATTRQ